MVDLTESVELLFTFEGSIAVKNLGEDEGFWLLLDEEGLDGGSARSWCDDCDNFSVLTPLLYLQKIYRVLIKPKS